MSAFQGLQTDQIQFITQRSKLEEEEKFALEDLPRMIKEKPDEVRFTLLQQMFELDGEYNKQRLKFLKKAFYNIIDYTVPKIDKVILMMMNKLPISRIVKLSSQNSRHNYKENSELSDFEKAIKDCSFSEESLIVIKNRGKELLRGYMRVRDAIKKMIKGRNRLIKSLYDLQETFITIELYKNYQKEDYVKLIDLMKVFESNGWIDNYALWGIRKKPRNKEVGSDSELSEVED